MPFFVKLHLISDTVTYLDMITMRDPDILNFARFASWYHEQILRQIDSYKDKVTKESYLYSVYAPQCHCCLHANLGTCGTVLY